MSFPNSEDQQYQSELSVESFTDSDVCYIPNYLLEDEADHLFSQLHKGTDWRQEKIKLFGKTHSVPRLSSWVADEGIEYTYSNITMKPEPWSCELSILREKLQSEFHTSFNSVLLNYYRHGQDSNGWHSDDEPELGQNPVIASISLGAARDFKFRHKLNKEKQVSIRLEHGSLLMMSGRTQSLWQHQIPKRANAGKRINLTFRKIIF